jgi:hypothetical protein
LEADEASGHDREGHSLPDSHVQLWARQAMQGKIGFFLLIST